MTRRTFIPLILGLPFVGKLKAQAEFKPIRYLKPESKYPTWEEAREIGPNWIRLCKFGDYPHPKGLQRIDMESASELIIKTKCPFPIYIGFPDVDPSADPRNVGWIKELKIEGEAILGLATLNHLGIFGIKDTVGYGPFWKFTHGSKGVIRPFEFISIGFVITESTKLVFEEFPEAWTNVKSA